MPVQVRAALAVVARLVVEPAQALAAAPLVVQLAVVQPQVALVLQPVAQLLQVVQPQLVPVLPLRRVQLQLQLQPRWVWWQPVWLLWLWWLLQRPRRMMWW